LEAKHFFGGKTFVALVGKTRARERRENESARTIRPDEKGVSMPKRIYPGRLTREEWQALPRANRHDLAIRRVRGAAT
jgi:hypothetical protein